MLQLLNKIYKKQQFDPSIISWFINPFYFVRKRIYNSVKSNALALNGKLLDFGCGRKPYKELFNTTHYIGLDIEQEGHDHTDEPIDVFYDGKTIPFPNNYFDSCFSSQVFEHVFELNHSIKEIHRVLKPGGKALFIVPFVWDEHEIPYDFARYSSFGLKYILEKHQFKIIKHEKDSHFFEVLIQLWCLYLYNLLDTKNKYGNILITLVFISPFTLLGCILKIIFPRIRSLYFNNVYLVEKINNTNLDKGKPN